MKLFASAGSKNEQGVYELAAIAKGRELSGVRDEGVIDAVTCTPSACGMLAMGTGGGACGARFMPGYSPSVLRTGRASSNAQFQSARTGERVGK